MKWQAKPQHCNSLNHSNQEQQIYIYKRRISLKFEEDILGTKNRTYEKNQCLKVIDKNFCNILLKNRSHLFLIFSPTKSACMACYFMQQRTLHKLLSLGLPQQSIFQACFNNENAIKTSILSFQQNSQAEIVDFLIYTCNESHSKISILCNKLKKYI